MKWRLFKVDESSFQAAYEATFAVAANLSQQRANARVCFVAYFGAME
jgi:hypothetical protein